MIAVEARRAANSDSSSDGTGNMVAAAAPVERRVLSLTQRRLADPAAVIAGLPADGRPLPSVAGYDELLALARRRLDGAAPVTEETA